MIKQKEIQEIAEKNKVNKATIDKDWVLSYLLNAFVSMLELKNIMIFKGGTCLRKCYFSNYRFSEDLDFTLQNDKFVFNKEMVQRILQHATNLSFSEEFNRGILFKLNKIETTKSKDEEQGFKIYIHYWGADHRKNDFPSENISNWHHSIKIVINHSEEIIFPVNSKPLTHLYSDNNKFINTSVACYSIEEVLEEKLRALIQRKYTSPRDSFDIWYLKSNMEELDWNKIKIAFLRKTKNKKISFEGPEQLLNKRKIQILRRHWSNQLTNQFPKDKIPGCDLVINDLVPFFKTLFE